MSAKTILFSANEKSWYFKSAVAKKSTCCLIAECIKNDPAPPHSATCLIGLFNNFECRITGICIVFFNN